MSNMLRTLATVLAIGVVSVPPSAFAQTPTGAAPSSVLPTGEGAALLDPSDTLILLLNHQAGLFQTVKDISIAELRANTTLMAKNRDAAQDPRHHDRIRAQWAERTADAGDPSIRAARGLRAAQGRG